MRQKNTTLTTIRKRILEASLPPTKESLDRVPRGLRLPLQKPDLDL